MVRSPSDLSTPPAWVADAIFYQIFPDRFAPSERVRKPGNLEDWDAPPTTHGFKGGDLLGIAERLDYLEELGVDALYLNPIFSSASNHRYHTYDYYEVDPLLGGEAVFRELLDAAHAKGFRVILDGVFNHASRGFWPFHHILECGEKSPYRDWFLIKRYPLGAYDESRKPGYAAWWDLHALPKFNVTNPDARAFLLDVAEHWTRQGIDGWRLDVPEEIDDPAFWRSFRLRVRGANPEAYLVGEIWDEAPAWLEGDRFDALMNYPFARAAVGFCAPALQTRYRPGGRALRRLRAKPALEALARIARLGAPDVVRSQLNLLGSHDSPRYLTLASGDHRALWLATLLQMTFPGAPCIYYGDEVGLEGGYDPGCRGSFPWDRSRWHAPTLEVFRRAIALRRREPVLRHGDFEPLLARGSTLAFLRRGEEGSILVLLNAGAERATANIALPEGFEPDGAPEELWAEDAPPASIASRGSVDLEVAAQSGRVMKLRARGRGE